MFTTLTLYSVIRQQEIIPIGDNHRALYSILSTQRATDLALFDISLSLYHERSYQ